MRLIMIAILAASAAFGQYAARTTGDLGNVADLNSKPAMRTASSAPATCTVGMDSYTLTTTGDTYDCGPTANTWQKRIRADAAGNVSICTTVPCDGYGTVISSTTGITGPSGIALDALMRLQYARPQFEAFQRFAAYPTNTAGLVGHYKLTGLGAVSSVPNLVAGGPALTLVGSPTIAAGGVTFADNQYAVTASTLSTISLATEWTMLLVGGIGGGPNQGRAMSMATTADQLHFSQAVLGPIGTYAQVYVESRNGSTDNNSASYVAMPPNITTQVAVALVSRWGNVRLSRLDVGSVNAAGGTYQEVANSGAAGAPLASIGCGVRNTASCVAGGSMSASYLMIWSRALSDLEMQQAYTWINTYGLGTASPLAPQTKVPALMTLPINGLTKTPPMGWTAWNQYFATATDANYRAQSAALVSTGLAALGYKYVEITDGWSGTRDATGNLVPVAAKFPSGMPALWAYIHGLGLKVTAYAGGGERTCGGYVGSFGYEFQDAQTFADWGADALKLDNCQSTNQYGASFTLPGYTTPADPMRAIYQLWGLAIRATGRPMLYNTSAGPNYGVETWGSAAGGNYWRYATDVDGWTHLNEVFDLQANLAQYAGPTKGWNDPDYIGCGNAGFVLTDDECRTQMSMWSILAAPLILGTDVTSMSAATLAAVGNSEVIAVDQDALGIQGVEVSSVACGSATCEVWVRQVTGTNTCAIALLNRASTAQNITATFATIAAAVPACGSGPYTSTRDLWAHASMGTLTTSYTATAIPSHGTFMFKVAP